MKLLKIGTRGSELALAQSIIFRDALLQAHPQLVVETVVVQTQGDIHMDTPIGPTSSLDKGAFTKELEFSLLRNEIHVAIHSLKDLPTEDSADLTIAAILTRGPTYDVLISKSQGGLHALPRNGRVATSSARRKAQILMLRPDLTIEAIRGNIPTRIRKLMETEGLDALILAGAGLQRLRLSSTNALYQRSNLHFDSLEDFLPAPGQGAIAAQARSNDSRTHELLKSVHDPITAECVKAERLLLEKLGGGCHLALGAHATKSFEGIRLQAVWFEGDQRHFGDVFAPTVEEVVTTLLNSW